MESSDFGLFSEPMSIPRIRITSATDSHVDPGILSYLKATGPSHVPSVVSIVAGLYSAFVIWGEGLQPRGRLPDRRTCALESAMATWH
jgi:hypothetical protein